jgi:F-type H+-transporting ATPase subunit epsilon
MADHQFELQIVTPEGVQLKEFVDELTAPSVQGQFGVLPGHRPMLAALSTGIISYTRGGGVTQVAVGAGYADINGDRAVVLTDRFSTKDAVDPVRVRLDLQEADQELSEHQGELNSPEFIDLVRKELWAATLLELHGDPPPPVLRGFDEARSAENYLISSLQDARGKGAEGSDGTIEE